MLVNREPKMKRQLSLLHLSFVEYPIIL